MDDDHPISEKFNNWINFFFLDTLENYPPPFLLLRGIQVDLECNANHLYAPLGSKRCFKLKLDSFQFS